MSWRFDVLTAITDWVMWIHVWIYAPEGDLDQALVWLVIWFLWDYDIWKYCFQKDV